MLRYVLYWLWNKSDFFSTFLTIKVIGLKQAMQEFYAHNKYRP